MREGLHVVLAGPPNVGKSSLLNRLAGEDLSIVTEVPGTTRDTIRQVIDLGGVPAYIIDTAGLRESEDPVERIGIERAWKAIATADAILLLSDATAACEPDDAIASRLPVDIPRIHVVNKIDLGTLSARSEARGGESRIWLSAKTGEGVDELRQALLNAVGWEGHGETAFLARERHLSALHAAATHLGVAATRAAQLELFAEELRLAHDALAAITGEFTADDLLGEIFSRFCIGK
jgi:tRNA modification GTPase